MRAISGGKRSARARLGPAGAAVRSRSPQGSSRGTSEISSAVRAPTPGQRCQPAALDVSRSRDAMHSPRRSARPEAKAHALTRSQVVEPRRPRPVARRGSTRHPKPGTAPVRRHGSPVTNAATAAPAARLRASGWGCALRSIAVPHRRRRARRARGPAWSRRARRTMRGSERLRPRRASSHRPPCRSRQRATRLRAHAASSSASDATARVDRRKGRPEAIKQEVAQRAPAAKD